MKSRFVQGRGLRSGTSVAAHAREAARARSEAEFISKLGGALQEVRMRLNCGLNFYEKNAALIARLTRHRNLSKKLTSDGDLLTESSERRTAAK